MGIDLEKLTPIQRLAAEDMIQRENNLKQLFSDHMTKSGRVIYEAEFVATFLPWLAGEVIDEKGEFYDAWVKVAGSPWSEVSLLDETGKEVAVVPAFKDSSFIGVAADAKLVPLRHLFQRTNRMAETTPAAADHYIAAALKDRYNISEARSGSKEWLEAWGAFLDRYGKRPKPKSGHDESQEGDQSDLLDYE